MHQELPEQLELPQRELHLVVPDEDLVALGVEHHVADAQHAVAEGRRAEGRLVTDRRLGEDPAAPQQRADASDELADPVGLRDVVVGADLDADDDVELLTA